MRLHKIFPSLVIALLLISFACTSTDEGPDRPVNVDAGVTFDRWGFPANHPLLGSRFLNIAHRGGGLLAPEESMEAYEKALEVGADMLEMDIHATSDGVLVLHHDPTVKRITGAAGTISQMTFAELRALDAGYTFTLDSGATYPYRGKGVVVATFREVLEAFPTAIFSAEIKQSDPPIVDEVLNILAETGMEERVILVSFDDSVVKDIRRKNPRVVTGASMGEMVSFGTLAQKDFAGYKPPCPVWQLSGIEPDLLAFADGLGMKVQIWTINDPAEMRAWMDMGVSGVMTDDPARLEGVIHGKVSD
jgi:glycerophosphoryl diester phosphodiesterase